MIKGVGTDILSIERIRSLAKNNANDSFIKKTYTSKEIELARERYDPILFYCTRFAGKEAVFKALHIDEDSIRLNEIEILEHPSGRPYVNLLGKIKSIANEKIITTIEISLTYETDYAVAFAVAY